MQDSTAQLRSLRAEYDTVEEHLRRIDAVSCLPLYRGCYCRSGLLSRPPLAAVDPLCAQDVERMRVSKLEAANLLVDATTVRHYHDDFETLKTEVCVSPLPPLLFVHLLLLVLLLCFVCADAVAPPMMRPFTLPSRLQVQRLEGLLSADDTNSLEAVQRKLADINTKLSDTEARLSTARSRQLQEKEALLALRNEVNKAHQRVLSLKSVSDAQVRASLLHSMCKRVCMCGPDLNPRLTIPRCRHPSPSSKSKWMMSS